jgi:hypothetical protein
LNFVVNFVVNFVGCCDVTIDKSSAVF